MAMNRTSWRRVAGVLVAVAVLVPTGLAWACVGLMSLTTSTSTVVPGGTLTVTGREFASGAPIEIHLDSPTGPVLATAPAPEDTMTSKFDVKVSIPANVPNGRHLLIATQQYHNMNAGAPARATVYVGTPVPVPAGPAARPANVVVRSGPSAASLVLVAFAVAAVGLVAAALWSMAAARRRPEPGTAGPT